VQSSKYSPFLSVLCILKIMTFVIVTLSITVKLCYFCDVPNKIAWMAWSSNIRRGKYDTVL